MRFYRRRHLRELDRIKMPFAKVDCTLPTGEVETLGSGKVLIFDKQKTEIVTGTVGYEELEEMDEAEKLIKDAKEKKI